MFASVYKISLNKGQRTPFHKKYYVFDGLGSLYFDTLAEARCYVRRKVSQLKNLYNESKSIYKTISAYYLDKLIEFRIYNSDNNLVNDLLSDILDAYKFITKQFFPHYALSKIKFIYNSFLNICKILKMRLLYKRIESLYNSYFTPYPVYKSSDYQVNKLKLNYKNDERCII